MKRLIFILFVICASIGMAQVQNTEIQIVPDGVIAYEDADNAPEYKGGQAAMYQKLSENLNYPADCAEAEIQGLVVVRFVVTSRGNVENVEVVKSVHSSLDAEAVRVVKLLNEWTPGMVNGEAVNVLHTLPISFKLNGGSNTDTPDYSTWTFFDLRDSLIAFFEDLYSKIPSDAQMTKANVVNEYVGVKCEVHFPSLLDEFKEVSEADMSLVFINELSRQLPFAYRKALADHNVKLTYLVHDDSTNTVYTVVIDKNTWTPESNLE